jgi:hypothetical protein
VETPVTFFMPRRRLSTSLKHQAVARRFYIAIEAVQHKLGLGARDIAKHYGLSSRSVYRWLKHQACPQEIALRKLCVKFRWKYDLMFENQAIANFIFEESHLSYKTLNRRYMAVSSNDPLESWNYVSLAGALLFNDLSAAGFETIMSVDHNFGARFSFRDHRLKKLGLQVGVKFGRGITLAWIDENGSVRGDTMVLSNSTLDLIKKTMHSYCAT